MTYLRAAYLLLYALYHRLPFNLPRPHTARYLRPTHLLPHSTTCLPRWRRTAGQGANAAVCTLHEAKRRRVPQQMTDGVPPAAGQHAWHRQALTARSPLQASFSGRNRTWPAHFSHCLLLTKNSRQHCMPPSVPPVPCHYRPSPGHTLRGRAGLGRHHTLHHHTAPHTHTRLMAWREPHGEPVAAPWHLHAHTPDILPRHDHHATNTTMGGRDCGRAVPACLCHGHSACHTHYPCLLSVFLFLPCLSATFLAVPLMDTRATLGINCNTWRTSSSCLLFLFTSSYLPPLLLLTNYCKHVQAARCATPPATHTPAATCCLPHTTAAFIAGVAI